MNKIYALTLILLILLGCNSQQEDKSLNNLEEILKKEIEQNLIMFDRRSAENPVKGDKSRRIAYGIDKNFKKVYSLIEASNPISDSIQKYFNNGLYYYGTSRIEMDSLIRGRVEIINNTLKKNTITNSKLELLISELECNLLSETFNDVDKNSFKFNVLRAIVVPEKTEVKSGEIYQAKIYIAAHDTTLAPSIKFEDEFLPLEDGYGTLRISSSTKGLKKYNGTIDWRVDGQNKYITLPYEIIYTVK